MDILQIIQVILQRIGFLGENSTEFQIVTLDQDKHKSCSAQNYDFNEYKMVEKFIDTESENQSSESIIQKINKGIGDSQYKIFTDQFDEIAKAESLDNE